MEDLIQYTTAFLRSFNRLRFELPLFGKGFKKDECASVGVGGPLNVPERDNRNRKNKL